MGKEWSRNRRSVTGTAQLVHPLTSRQKMFMVLASHIAPKGCPSDSARCAVAALLATQAEWDRFGRTWSAEILQETGEVGNPNLAHRKAQQKDQGRALLDLLQESRVAAITCVSGEGVPDLDTERKQILPGNARDPGFPCVQHCVMEAVRRSGSLPEGERVCFIMDWNDPLASTALWCLEDLKNLSSQGVSERLGALGFESRPSFPPLQAAAWLAQEYACQEQPSPSGLEVARSI